MKKTKTKNQNQPPRKKPLFVLIHISLGKTVYPSWRVTTYTNLLEALRSPTIKKLALPTQNASPISSLLSELWQRVHIKH